MSWYLHAIWTSWDFPMTDGINTFKINHENKDSVGPHISHLMSLQFCTFALIERFRLKIDFLRICIDYSILCCRIRYHYNIWPADYSCTMCSFWQLALTNDAILQHACRSVCRAHVALFYVVFPMLTFYHGVDWYLVLIAIGL